MINNKRAIVPGLLTLGNLTCGYLSIVFAAQGEFVTAGYLIIASAFFDLIDGLAARLLNAASNFGVQLDSLADIVGFGAPTAFLVYKFKLEEFGTWGLVISLLFLVSGALRLARFNTQVSSDLKKKDYTGIPIPVGALIVTLLILAQIDKDIIPWSWKWLFPFVTILTAAGMVSKIKFAAFPKFNKSLIEKSPVEILLVLILPFAIYFYGITGLFFLFIFGILFNIAKSYVTSQKKTIKHRA
ncbi:MAG: CDP-diacylglycerol--serine O-phosphatidyltransferase [Bacteroidetes bacterium]|nr:CDP-diacylglycerol--serine O-phosphatidyltransferase [Bacteroidota bacterium]